MTIPSTVWAFLQRWEGGGQFHKVAGDPGGATKWGISFRFIRNLPVKDADANKDGVVNWRDVFDLDEEKARTLYSRYFWEPLRCHELPPALAFALFDTAVNCGRTRTVRWLQSCAGAGVDGVFGPKTLAAVRLNRPAILSSCTLSKRDDHYAGLVAGDPDRFGKFLAGWQNRVNALRAEIQRMAATLDTPKSEAQGATVACPHCGGALAITQA